MEIPTTPILIVEEIDNELIFLELQESLTEDEELELWMDEEEWRLFNEDFY
jgi:hypothetical protein